MPDRAPPEFKSQRDAGIVYGHPQLVVEIAFDGIQTRLALPRRGLALRTRVRYRDDKRAEEADTIATVRSCTPRPFMISGVVAGGRCPLRSGGPRSAVTA